MIDPQRYPLTAAYLGRLPQGAASYPECKAKADIHKDLPSLLAELRHDSSLPHEVLNFLQDGPPGDWMSEVLANAALLLVRDTIKRSDEDFFAWDFQRNITLFQRPLNKMIVAVFSTTLLIMGATKRWSSFHQGTTLMPDPVSGTGGKKMAGGTLSYPPHLYDERLVRMMCGAYRAALKVVKAKNPTLDIERVSPTSAHFVLGWDDN